MRGGFSGGLSWRIFQEDAGPLSWTHEDDVRGVIGRTLEVVKMAGHNGAP